MDISESFSTLRSVWRDASRALKKEITRHVAEKCHPEFRRWTKGIRGFRPDSLASRSSEQVGQLMDDHLFRIQDGQFAAEVISSFLCDVRPELNLAFMTRFLERATADRRTAAKEVRDAVLHDLVNAGHAPEILSLYAATLACVEPRYSTETPPEDAFLSTVTSWAACRSG